MMLPEHIHQIIASHGFVVIAVHGTENSPSFAYTIGLSAMAQHPELLVFGLNRMTAHMLLSDVANRILAGKAHGDGDVLDDVANFPLALRTISSSAAEPYAVQLFHYYRHLPTPPSVMQMVLSDEHGRLPWEEEYTNRMRACQPELWPTLH